MNESKLETIEQIREFLAGTSDIAFTVPTDESKRRAFATFGDQRFARLSRISVSHLYNLRKAGPYRKQRLIHQATRPSRVLVGIRKAPAPQGLPGYSIYDALR